MSSKLEENLARKALALRKAGGGIDNSTAKSARLILEGKGTAADVQIIRNALGIRRSGASAMRGNINAITGVARSVGNITRDLQLANGSTPMAAGRVVFDVADAITSNRRTLTKLAEGTAKAIGRDPLVATRFMYSLGRFARIIGPAGMAVAGVAGAVDWIHSKVQNIRSGFKAEGDIYKTAATFRNPILAREMEERSRSEVAARHWFNPDESSLPGIDLAINDMRANRSKDAAERMKYWASYRQEIRDLRDQAGTTYRADATEKGLFSQQKMNERLDQGRMWKFEKGPEYASRLRDLEPTEPELQAWYRKRDAEEYGGTWLLGGRDGFRGYDEITSNWNYAADRQRWGDELRKKRLELYKAKFFTFMGERQSDFIWRHMKPAERQAIVMDREEKMATYNGFRSRHQMVTLD